MKTENKKARESLKPKSFLKKHWSNILFFGVVILFLIPTSRSYLQSKLAYIFSSTPTIVENNQQNLTDYNFVLKDLDGKSINLKQSQGRPVLINFWATWCAPCLAELPELNALYENNKNEVDFYFISQEKPEVLKKFLKLKNYNLPVYTQVSVIPFPLKNNALPSTYLINRNGKIVAFAEKSAKWNDKEIQSLINEM